MKKYKLVCVIFVVTFSWWLLGAALGWHAAAAAQETAAAVPATATPVWYLRSWFGAVCGTVTFFALQAAKPVIDRWTSALSDSKWADLAAVAFTALATGSMRLLFGREPLDLVGELVLSQFTAALALWAMKYPLTAEATAKKAAQVAARSAALAEDAALGTKN